MTIMTLLHTEGIAASGVARVRGADCPSTLGAFGTTGFATAFATTAATDAKAFAPYASSQPVSIDANWQMNERKSMNPVDIHLPRPPDL